MTDEGQREEQQSAEQNATVTRLRPRSARAQTRDRRTAALSLRGLVDPRIGHEEIFEAELKEEVRKPATVTSITTRTPRQRPPGK